MKKFIIIFAIIFASCSEEEVKPELPACSTVEAYKKLEREIKIYRETPGNDWAILADMRKELEAFKNQTCK